MTRNETVFFTDEAIINFLRQYGKGPESKDYEFLVALMMSRFCEEQWRVKCKIGFPIKQKQLKELPAVGEIELPDLARLFREGIDEDTLIDFLVLRDDGDVRPKAAQFQVKRFGVGQRGDVTGELTEYLNSLPARYDKSTTILLLIPDDGVTLNFAALKSGVRTEAFPFTRIMLAWLSGDKINIGEIYPKYGMQEYDIKYFLPTS